MKEDIKNTIKQTVDNHSDNINPDVIWSGIENKLRKIKKRNFVAYWVFGLLSFALAFIIYTYMQSFSVNDEKTNTQFATTNAIGNDILATTKINENRIENKIHFTNNNDRVNTIKKDSIKNLNSTPLASIKINSARPQKALSNITNLNEKLLEINKSELVDYSFFDATESLPRVTEIKSNTTKAFRKLEDRALIIINHIKGKKITPIATLKNEIFITYHEKYFFDSPYIDTEKNFNFLTKFELFGGLSIGNKSISDIDASYAKNRNDSEQLLEQWSAGLRLNLLSILDFNFNSGIRYSMITDRMRPENKYNGLNYTFTKAKFINNEIVVIDNPEQIDTTDEFVYLTEQYNSQRVISIPLEISFGKSIQKFELGISFGVDLNYQFKDTHVILNPEGMLSVNNVGGKWISPTFSVAFLSGYHLNTKWSIISRFNYRGLTLSDHETIRTLKSSYNLFGLELGIKRSISY